MKKNLITTVKQTLTNIFRKQLPGISVSTQDALGDVDPRQKVLDEVIAIQRKTGLASAEHLKVLAALFYQVDIQGTYYKLKDFNRYGQCFELESVRMCCSMTPDGVNSLDDLKLHFIDGSLSTGTSAEFTVSVKDLNEWMTPVVFPTPNVV